VIDTNVDREVLIATFVSRVKLAKMSREAAAEEGAREWDETNTWFASASQASGSFLWYCDEFGLEPDAVRRAIRERK